MRPGSLQDVEQPLVRLTGRTLGTEHHDIDSRKPPTESPKALSRDPFESIAIDRTAGAFFGDGQTETRLIEAIGTIEYDETLTTGSIRVGEDALELTRLGQASFASKSLSGVAGSFQGAQGIRRARPLARRALRTLRPLRVALRARKPWVRARFRRLG